MFKCRFLRIQTMSFIEIVPHSCKCDFSKTHLQYDARILFRSDPFRYTVEVRIRKCSHFVIKSESQRQIRIKNRNFPRYLQLSCKAISLAKCFSPCFFKSESRRVSWPKPSRKVGPKREKVMTCMANVIVLKCVFWNQEAARAKMSEKSSKIKKVPKKVMIWSVWKENILTNQLLTWDEKTLSPKISNLVQSKIACECIF